MADRLVFDAAGDAESRSKSYKEIASLILLIDLERISAMDIPGIEQDPELFYTGFTLGAIAIMERIHNGTLSLGKMPGDKEPE